MADDKAPAAAAPQPAAAAAAQPPAAAAPAQLAAAAQVHGMPFAHNIDHFLAALPPLQRPRYDIRMSESIVGATLVLSIVAACVSATTASLFWVQLSPAFTWGLCGIVWAEAATALVCLVGLLFGDPGVVPRSAKNCMPPPDAISRKFHAGENLADSMHENVTEANPPFRSYCARCFVYRSSHKTAELAAAERRQAAAETASCMRSCFACGGQRRIECCPAEALRWGHHCSTCQRCVEDFDHHCGVFGRCIAGRGFSGNMGYFKVMLVMGQVGPLTTALAVAIGLVARYGILGVGYAAAILGGACCAVTWLVPSVRLGLMLLRKANLSGASRPRAVNYAAEHAESRAGAMAAASSSTSPPAPKVTGKDQV